MRARSTSQEDYLERLIKQAAAALRVLRHRLAGTSDSPEAIRAQTTIAIGMLLGDRASLLERLDATSAAQLVGHAEHVEVWAALLDVEAEAAGASGAAPTGAALHERAKALRSASASLWGRLE